MTSSYLHLFVSREINSLPMRLPYFSPKNPTNQTQSNNRTSPKPSTYLFIQ